MVDAVPHRARRGSTQWNGDAAVLVELSDAVPAAGQPPAPAIAADARIDNRAEILNAIGATELGPEPTDAELILAAYRRWDLDAAARLIGDFAFVIWDKDRRRVYAARDPMGLRPLYYRIEPGRRALFASEAKQILAAPGVPRSINESAVARHMSNRFDPLDWSFYEGIDVLPPGHSVTVEESGSRTWRHWDFDPKREIAYRTEDEYIEHFRELVIEAVRCRVGRERRPIGVLLSGGMDSGTAAGVAGWLRAEGEPVPEVRAYTWDFGDLGQCDERHISTHLIDRFGFAETPIPVAHLGPLAEYPQHGPDLDTPFLGSFQPGIERSLEVAAGDGCGLVMSGDRGDLVSGAQIVSYPHLVRVGKWRQLGRELRRQRAATGEPMSTILLRDLMSPAIRRLRRRSRRPAVPELRYPPWMEREFAVRTGVADGLGPVDFGGVAFTDGLREERRRLILEPMHMRGVMWTERTHAKAGLGFADPWSDRRLAEFVVAIPPQVINRPGRNDKQLAKKAMAGVLPDTFLAAARKILPTPLYRRGLFEDGVSTVQRLLVNSRAAAAGYIDERQALAAYENARLGGPDPIPIWPTICVEMWFRALWDEP